MATEWTQEAGMTGETPTDNVQELADVVLVKTAEAGASAAAAAASETNAANIASNSLSSETNAAESEANAAISESNAASSATNASNSAAAASTSKTNASVSAIAASSSAGDAAASATTALGHANDAAVSEANAATSEANAAASEASAGADAIATAADRVQTGLDVISTAADRVQTGLDATAADNSASAASASETNAASSASTATTQAGIATTQASNAATSASNSLNSANNSASSATASINAKTASEAARDATLAALDSFDDRYLGQKSVDPTLDNDGNALQAGALFFNTTTNSMMVYDGSVWLAAYASLSGALMSDNNLGDLSDVQAALVNLSLNNVDNTSDLNKPISTATQTALNGKVDDSQVLTNVPSGALFTDTIYNHPASHPATMITTTDEFAYSNSGNVQDVLDDLDQAIANVNAKDPVITLTGDVSGSGTMTNLGNVSITATVADDSHNHTIANIDGLQTALDNATMPASEILTAIKTVDGAGSGLDADTLDGQHASSFASASHSHSNYMINNGNTSTTGYIEAEGFVGSGGTGTHILAPHGAHFATSVGTITGAIKITLPTSWTSTMLRFTVKVFEYSTGESFDIVCAGYNYNGGYWVNTTAYILGDPHINRNFNVRFGHDGSKCCVYIGETGSTWSYPQVAVTEFYAGFSNYAVETWNDNWAVSFATSLGTITTTHTNNEIGRYVDGNTVWHSGNDGSGSGLDADTVDGLHASSFASSSHTHPISQITGVIEGTSFSGTYPVMFSIDGSTRIFSHSGLTYTGSSNTLTTTNVTVTGTLIESSDARLKENVETLTNPLEKVMSLRGVSYNKIETPDRPEIGFIAQEVEEVVSEIVDTDAEGMKAVSYARTVALLVEAIKEQQEQIDGMQAKINDLVK